MNKRILTGFVLCLVVSASVLLLSAGNVSSVRNHRQIKEELIQRYDGMSADEIKESFSEDYSQEQWKTYYSTLKEICGDADYIQDYSTYIQETVETSRKLTGRRIFSKENSFSLRNAEKTGRDFSEAKSIQIHLVNTEGISVFLHYTGTWIFSAIFLLNIIAEYMRERKRKMLSLLTSTAKGRFVLFIRRLAVMELLLLIYLILSSSVNLALSIWMYGGSNALAEPIQSIQAFKGYPYVQNCAEYLCIVFCGEFLALSLCGIAGWCLYELIPGMNLTTFVLFLVFGGEWLLSRVPLHSRISIFRDFNVLRLFDLNTILGTYKNLDVFGIPVSGRMCFLIVLATVLAVVLLILGWSYHIGRRRQERLVLPQLLSTQIQKILASESVVFKELSKMLFSCKGLIIITVSAGIMAVITISGRADYSESQKSMDAIYLQQGGENFDEIRVLVEERLNDYASALERFDEAKRKNQEGRIDATEYFNEVTTYHYYQDAYAAVKEMDEKIQRIDQVKQDKNLSLYLMSDRGYEMILGPKGRSNRILTGIIWLIAVLLTTIRVLSFEDKTGMIRLITSSAKGIGWNIRMKMATFTLFWGMCFCFLYCCRLIWYRFVYGLPYLNAPLQSLAFTDKMLAGDALAGVPVWCYLVMMLIMGLLLTELVCFIGFVISAKLIQKRI